MESDRAVVPNQEGDESSVVFDPSIQASLPRTSSVVSENIAAGDDRSAGMEPSLPVASSKTSEIIETEGDPRSGMEPSLPVASSKTSEIIETEGDPRSGMEPSSQTTSSMRDPAEDNQSSEPGSTSSPKISEVNPFIEELSRASHDMVALEKYFSELKEKLKDGLQEEAVYAFLQHNITEAQKKVQELFYLFEAIDFGIELGKKNHEKMERLLRETLIPRKDSHQQNFKEYVCRIDIYYHLFIHALACAKSKLQEPHLDFIVVAFMIFLTDKVKEEDLKDPSLTFTKMYQEAKTNVTDYIHSYEKETISAFIILVINDKEAEAEYFFGKCLLDFMKRGDIINHGRVFNYTLRKMEKLNKVRKFLRIEKLSTRYKFIVQYCEGWNEIPRSCDQEKVHEFVMKLYKRDVHLQKFGIGELWKVVEQHDYHYLVKCVWEYHKQIPDGVSMEHYDWEPLQLNYIFTSSAALTFGGPLGGKDIMEHLLFDWPKLVNAPYKGVTALHVAAFRRNKEAIKFLLKQDKLDINVRTGRLITEDDVKRYQKNGPETSTQKQRPYASVVQDREKMIKDLLQKSGIEVNLDRPPDGKFIKNIKTTGKKWNMNRWELPTSQTALHIATTEKHAKVVQLLCDVNELHQQRLRSHEEDEEDRTPLDILYASLKKEAEDSASSRIKKALLNKQDVQNGIDRLYRNRQVLVDAVNTILVGAALIASVTYAGWLQPPLGYATDYALAEPYPAPPDTYDSYLAVQGNLGVKVFALFNALSFYFAIATVIVGANAAFPQQKNEYIGHSIEEMQPLLRRAIRLFIISLVCVLGAFGSAAIVVLPPSLFFKKDLVLIIIIGGGLCGFAMWRFLSRHTTLRKLNDYIANYVVRINKFANVL